MRKWMIAAAALSMATGASAQRMVAQGPGADFPPPSPGGYHAAPPMPAMSAAPGGRWGERVDGRWAGGARAPGGWASYRRPYRGYVLPGYWLAPGFLIGDWASYGLGQPAYGYNWVRYYDDAVLIDSRGAVSDSVSGIDWDRYDAGPGAAPGYAYQQPGAGYPPPSPADGYYRRGSNGVTGALVGGAAGGVAGGLIAGRHDKVGGALIGAGAGALLGYAVDKGSGRRDYAPPPPGAGYPPPGAGYPPPGPGYTPPPMMGRGRYAPPSVIESGAGATVVTTTTGGVPAGTYVNGVWYPPATVTTVTIASAPVVTTTTEVFEDSVTYTRALVHRFYRPVRHRPVPRCGCR